MNAADYARYDAVGLADLVARGAVSPGEVLDAALAALDAHNPVLNAVVMRHEDEARAAIAAGLPAGRFRGVPFLLKDLDLALAGTPLTQGSELFRGFVPDRDSTLVARYKAAGLVIFGKTNSAELGLSFTTEPAAYGPTRHPRDPALSPGGSSGGAAAAVASGMVPMAHGTDGGGSIRQPAALTGLFGLKPSRGRTPAGPEASEVFFGLSVSHALTRSVRDSAALLDASAGPDQGDPYAAPQPERPFLAELDRDPPPLRIGLTLRSPLGTPVDPQCLAAARAIGRLCEELGHHVEETDTDYDAPALKAAWRVIVGVNVAPAVALQGERRGLADPLALVEPVNAAWIEEARGKSGVDYLRAVNQLHATARALGRFFARYDVLLSPAVAELPPLLGQMAGAGQSLDAFYDQFWRHGPFTCAFNASGCPAMSVPATLSAEGLPIGAQLGAGFGRDGLLFALAGQLERARPWAGRRPPSPSRTPQP